MSIKEKLQSNRISNQSYLQPMYRSKSKSVTFSRICCPGGTVIVHVQSLLEGYSSGYPGDLITPAEV